MWKMASGLPDHVRARVLYSSLSVLKAEVEHLHTRVIFSQNQMDGSQHVGGATV